MVLIANGVQISVKNYKLKYLKSGEIYELSQSVAAKLLWQKRAIPVENRGNYEPNTISGLNIAANN